MARKISAPAAVAKAVRGKASPKATARTKPVAKSRPSPGRRGRSGAVTVRVLRLPHAEGLPMPAYQTAGAAGLDLVAAVDSAKPLRLGKGQHALVPTGLVIELPAGTEAQVRPRSGLAMKHGVTVLNAPGTIDCDYRGEVCVLLVNLGPKAFKVQRGERIAQLVVAPVAQARLVEARALDATARGAGGFGSTGLTQSSPAGQPAPRGSRKSNSVPSGAQQAKKRAPATPAAKSRGRRRT